MKSITLIYIFLVLFFSAGCSSRNERLDIVTVAASRLDVGMNKSEVITAIGSPRLKGNYTPQHDSWEDIIEITRNDEIYYPHDLPQHLNCFFEGWTYFFKLGVMDDTVLHLYFSQDEILLGFSTYRSLKPPTWDEMIAQKERKAQPIRQGK